MITLHEKFIRSSLAKRLTLEEVSQQIMDSYQAKVIGKEILADLKDDPYVNFDQITHCFSIPEEVVDKLRSETERLEAEESIQQILQYGSLSAEEKELVIRGEKSIALILESRDQRYVERFTIQGESTRVLTDMICLQGMNPSSYTLENEDYVVYLEALHEKGLI